jgi:hypothetical protein
MIFNPDKIVLSHFVICSLRCNNCFVRSDEISSGHKFIIYEKYYKIYKTFNFNLIYIYIYIFIYII